MIAHYPARNRRFTTWKNGGGETAKIICQPTGAGFDDFDWASAQHGLPRQGRFRFYQA
ncbi:HutD family protein [Paracoccus xiamenensis]|uniref:HutD family protein n=1 Tax=Paracoccus xiamenensis TaxID=2714901 RepID=UPI00140D5961|nr:HutD family protein [Paracoccus xiamenensis]NHF72673.1 hypothetical protein [Paracoccus xiamenensis]